VGEVRQLRGLLTAKLGQINSNLEGGWGWIDWKVHVDVLCCASFVVQSVCGYVYVCVDSSTAAFRGSCRNVHTYWLAAACHNWAPALNDVACCPYLASCACFADLS
jgi:hypothetical protein